MMKEHPDKHIRAAIRYAELKVGYLHRVVTARTVMVG